MTADDTDCIVAIGIPDEDVETSRRPAVGVETLFTFEFFTSGKSITGSMNGLLKIVASSGMENVVLADVDSVLVGIVFDLQLVSP